MLISLILSLITLASAAITDPHRNGTPKTLHEAVRNGIECSLQRFGEINPTEIEAHVLDFIAQKITTMAIRHQEADDVLLKTYNLIRHNESRCKWLGVLEEGGPAGE